MLTPAFAWIVLSFCLIAAGFTIGLAVWAIAIGRWSLVPLFAALLVAQTVVALLQVRLIR